MKRTTMLNDPKSIWQSQPTEPSTMTLEKVRLRARDLHARTRRELLGSIATPVIVIGMSGWGIALTHNTALRLIFALGIVWALAGQYFLHRGMWPATLPGDAALNTGLEFYRREVTRRRYLFGRVLQWSFGPAMLSVGAWIATIIMLGNRQNLHPFVNMIPFLALLFIWIVAVFVIRMRHERELRREIDDLRNLEDLSR
jgi:hypothetical protein